MAEQERARQNSAGLDGRERGRAGGAGEVRTGKEKTEQGRAR